MSSAELQRAIRLHRSGQLEEALSCYQGLIDNGNDDPRVISLLGQLQLQLGAQEDALANLRRAAETAPDNLRITLSYARGLAASGYGPEARDLVKRILEQDHDNADAWATMAAVQRHLGDHAAELEAARRASALAPGDPALLLARANAEAANLQLAPAVTTLQQAAQLAPHNARILNNLGALLLRLNRNQEAVTTLQQALELQPGYPTATTNLATALHHGGRLTQARSVAEHAVSLNPGNTDARVELASILLALGDLTGAEAAYQAARQASPDNQRVIAGLAELRERQGQPQAGLQLLEDLLETRRASHDTRLVAASLARRTGRRDLALHYLEPLLDREGDPVAALDLSARRRLCFLLGDIHDAGSDYRVALRYYDLGNGCVTSGFDVDDFYRYIDRIIQRFPVAPLPGPARHSPQRLLIVGMPRSGTGLLDAMLSRHPQIHACGELTELAQLLRRAKFPDRDMEDDEYARLGDQYCRAVAAPPGTRWMTDRTPLNFLYLGAVARMLPGAHILFCQRDPGDTLLSCYFQNFLDPTLEFSFRLEHLGHFYRNCQRLMRHWQPQLDHMITTVRYEDLVSDPGMVMQPLLEKLQLEWHDAVLQPRPVEGAGSTSRHLGEAIHRRSVGRFARYRPFLGDRAEMFDSLR